MSEEKTKVCKCCGEEKSIVEYHKHSRSKEGYQRYRSTCKACVSIAKVKEYRQKHPLTKKQPKEGYRICSCCGCEKPLESFNEKYMRKDGGITHTSKCKCCIKVDNATYYENNKEVIREQQKDYAFMHKQDRTIINAEYREAHKDELKLKKSLYRQENPEIYNASVMRRKVTKLRATPVWFDTEEEEILLMYNESSELTKYIMKTHVDHIVPITSDYVCGLHCLANLRITPAEDNISKGNRWWPDMWEYK